ncbi:hypothetical protein PsorP6_011715 [Peronosclerospora sorghi]|uniref:Uncharacterized protein n=1 Tax=Peronosclerospora sorghi TaxID=230839 RepID=A0ACC0WJJ0_9STRA|nr:hypothetical protein PsorP6_011715 [Peronosclerospora sorghi]
MIRRLERQTPILHKLEMADLQSKMEARSQDIDRAKNQIPETTQKKHSNFEPAGQYLRSGTGCIPGGDSEVENSGPRSFRTNGSCSNRLHGTSSLIA